MEEVLSGLRAAGESTRLRILAILDRTELTVAELCQVLGQSQPRVSRHLKLLVESGLLSRHRQGTRAYFRPARTPVAVALRSSLLPLIDANAADHRRDLERLAEVRAARADAAAAYFEDIAGEWDQMRDLHVADATVEQAMLDAVDGIEVGDLLDIGTGTGRVLEVFADRIRRGIGVDLSRPMLDLARSRLDDKGLRHCSVRQGDLYDLRLDAGGFDVAVLHHVLHFLDDPAEALAEVARVIRPSGRLIIVDFAPHSHEVMRSEFAHHWLGFADDDVVAWCQDAGFSDVELRHLAPATSAGKAPKNDDLLTTTLWCAHQRADAPSLHSLKAVS